MNAEPLELTSEVPSDPVRRAFPVVWQAVMLCGLSSGAQFGLSVAFLVLPMAFFAFLSVPFPPTVALTTMAVTNLLACALVIAVARLWSGQSFGTLLPLSCFRLVALPPMVITIAGLNVLLSEADNVMRYFFPMPEVLREMLQGLIGQTWPSALLLVLVAPITEEPLFRGIILGGFRRNYSVVWAAVLSSLLFALVHMNPWQFFSAFVLGLLFSWWMLRTGSLWSCLFGHALWNGLTVGAPLLPMSIQGYNHCTAEAPFQPIWFDLAGLGVALFGIWWLHRIFAMDTPEPKLTSSGVSE